MTSNGTSANKSPKKSFRERLFGGAKREDRAASPCSTKPVMERCLTISSIRRGKLDIEITDGKETYEAILAASSFQTDRKPALGDEVEILRREMRVFWVRPKPKTYAQPQPGPSPQEANIKRLYGT